MSAQNNPAKPHISFVIYENMYALDFLGPASVLTAMGLFDVDYVARSLDPVYGDTAANKKLGYLPTAAYADISQTDIICVPGTTNPYIHMRDDDMIGWLETVGKNAQWITSVCTGSLILGAAGLLKGYKATSHWYSVEDLAYVGAEPVFERVVRDRNRVTGAGVTSGIDFGLTLLAILRGEEEAKNAQLYIEYDPAPPFVGGSVKSDPARADGMRQFIEVWEQENIPYARETLENVAKRLGVANP
ncbi:MAG: DJ-1/PfpI family protein [Syntrophobacterales bacterium]|jgi:putative intracellular protease/amidase|nr:DJ-1/PfpI family protein [Syntrophobacterales bacterium]